LKTWPQSKNNIYTHSSVGQHETPDEAKVGSIVTSKHPVLTGQPHKIGKIDRFYKILRVFYWKFDVSIEKPYFT
jgi:hypothetical protein